MLPLDLCFLRFSFLWRCEPISTSTYTSYAEAGTVSSYNMKQEFFLTLKDQTYRQLNLSEPPKDPQPSVFGFPSQASAGCWSRVSLDTTSASLGHLAGRSGV